MESLKLDFISIDDAVEMDGLHIILVNHSNFKTPLKKSLKGKKVLDFQGIL